MYNNNSMRPFFDSSPNPLCNNKAISVLSSSSSNFATNSDSRGKKDDAKTSGDDEFPAVGCRRCWICEVPLLLSYEDIHNSLISPSQSPCFYKSYPHPFLAMLSESSLDGDAQSCFKNWCVCAVCADRVLSVEQDVLDLPLTENVGETDGCSLCGTRIQPQENPDEEGEEAENRQEGEEEVYTRKLTAKEMGLYFEDGRAQESLLLLCDTCPRAFCYECWKQYKPTFHDISEPLLCPMCTDSRNERPSCEEKPKALVPAEKLDINKLSCLLEAYEAELLEVEKHRSLLHLVKKKEEILQELLLASSKETLNKVDTDQINLEAQQDLIMYRQLWELHAVRLQVEIPVLQELLEIAGGSLHEFYEKFQQVKEALFPEERNSIFLKVAEEKSVSKANLYLQTRHSPTSNEHCVASNFIGASGYKAKNERIYELDLYPSSAEEEDEIDDDRYLIEDIQSVSDALDAKNHLKIHPCWRASCTPKESMFRKALKEEDSRNKKINDTICTNNDKSTLEQADRFRLIVHRKFLQDDDDKEEDGEAAFIQQIRHCKESQLRASLKQSSHTQRREKRKRARLNASSEEENNILNDRKRHIWTKKKYASLENATTSSMTHSPKLVDEVNTLNQDKVREFLDCFSSRNIYLESNVCLYDPRSKVVAPTLSFHHSDTSAPLEYFLKDKVTIAEPIAKYLKEHQKEGIQFMWDNICGTHQDIHGCILAHNMGLGKSLQTIAFIHTLLTHPAIQVSDINCSDSAKINNASPKKRLIRTVLLLAPVNTLSNWENEFMKWVKSSYEPRSSKPCDGAPQLGLYPVYRQMNDQRRKMIEHWYANGGVLLSSPQKFTNIVNESSEKLLQQALLSPGPDLVIVDEAHGVFNKEGKKIEPIISLMRAPRRIALTGTPFQNNLYEYYVMANWVRPGCLNSIAEFKKDYVTPIMDGLKADSLEYQKRRQEELIHDLYKIFLPFVHRKDSTILQQDLPLLQQTVLVVRQSRVQQRILQLHKNYQRLTTKNFLDAYSKLKPVFNHPGTLLLRRTTTPSQKSCNENVSRKYENNSSKLNTLKNSLVFSVCETEMKDTGAPCDTKVASNRTKTLVECSTAAFLSSVDDGDHHLPVSSMQVKKEQIKYSVSQAPIGHMSTSNEETESDIICILDSDDEELGEINVQSSTSLVESQWWSDILRTVRDLNDIEHGGKMIIILQILAQADDIGEKVVVFSHSLQTLDFIEKLLNQTEWETQVPAISRMFPGKTWGPWKKNVDYVRIDGGTEASTRGDLITQFNEENGPKSNSHLKLFLLSSKAGGVGINLVAATRVIIVDPHFNPAVDLQALFRCYRYGQTKPVFVYRLLCEGTMEEKVYRRQVNKTSLSKRLIDRNNPTRHFTSRELDDIGEVDLWVQCDSCDKWRMLHPCMQNEVIPEKWYCSMNIYDPDRSTCAAKERDQRWYARYFDSHCTEALVEELHSESQSEEKEVQTKRDTILCRILNAQRGDLMRQRMPGRKVKNWLSKYHFHDALLKDDPALSGIRHPSSIESTPARQNNSSSGKNPHSASIPIVSICREDNLSVVPTYHFTSTARTGNSTPNHPNYQFNQSRQVDKTPINPDSNSIHFQNGSLFHDREAPQPTCNSVIEILSSDEDYDSDFEILS